MANPRVRLNNAAIGKLLKSPAFAALVNGVAAEVAAAAGSDAEVDHYTTDRGAAAVKVPAADQAMYGTLTRAAEAVGLEVKQKP
ncbi:MULTISPECIES: hypothetical protein [Nocardia]|uniref:hypothetical protein n=1 Tax=Nocardia TaxID=1817 RepID=UPI0007A4BF7E|nr:MULTISPECIES: hypothetical protein [Nocardia]